MLFQIVILSDCSLAAFAHSASEGPQVDLSTLPHLSHSYCLCCFCLACCFDFDASCFFIDSNVCRVPVSGSAAPCLPLFLLFLSWSANGCWGSVDQPRLSFARLCCA